MKKTALLGLTCLAVGVVSSYGQGYISLDNYYGSVNALITYGENVPADGVGASFGSVGSGLDSSWTVGIYFVSGTVDLNEAAGNGLPSSLLALGTGSGSTAQIAGSSVFGTDGSFSAANYFYTGSANGTVTLEIVAYNGADYASSDYRGHSAAFTMPTVAQSSPIASYVGDYMSTFGVTPVPEPSTLALAGLSGFGMLMALRRKKA